MKKLLSLLLMLSLGLTTVTPALNATQSQTVAESQANPADASGWQAAKKWWRSGRKMKALNAQEKKAFASLMKKFTIRVIIAAIIAMIGGITYKKYRSEQKRKAQEAAQNPKLISAAALGDLEAAKEALDKGASANAKNWMDGLPVLIIAILMGHLDIVSLLIEKGANVDAQTDSKITALMNAALGGHLEIVRLLIEKGANVDAQDENGETALMLAIKGDYVYDENIINLLIAKSKKLNTENKDKKTALMLANERLGDDSNPSLNIKAALKK